MRTTKNFNRTVHATLFVSLFQFSLSSAYKNLNDLKKEFHEKIESLTNGSSDSNAANESTSSSSSARAGTSSNQQQPTVGRRPVPDDPLIDPLAAGRRPHPYQGGW